MAYAQIDAKAFFSVQICLVQKINFNFEKLF